MSRSRKVTHAHVERARQALVVAEEAYLLSQGWHRVQIAEDWLWRKVHPVGGGGVTMRRSDAVWFQYIKLGDGK